MKRKTEEKTRSRMMRRRMLRRMKSGASKLSIGCGVATWAHWRRTPYPFHLRLKAHLLQHLVEDQLDMWGSPSLFWCYGDENFIGAMKETAAKSKHPHTLEDREEEGE